MTTYERLMKNPDFKKEFDKGYNDFLISEFMIEKMEEEKISVRELAKKSNISPNGLINMIENSFFKKKHKYIIKQSFSLLNSSFINGEELIYQGCGFAPYDELWNFSFKTLNKDFKYLVVKDQTEFNHYLNYFEEK